MDRVIDSSPWRVSGDIKDDGGNPLSSLLVRAFDCDIKGGEGLLGETKTDDKGHYEIAYAADKAKGGLRVRVFSGPAVLEVAVSEIDYKAGEHAVIDFVIAARLLQTGTEWERYGKAIDPLLDDKEKKLKLRDLTDAQLDFIAGKTKIDTAHLHSARTAATWSEDNDLPAEAVYGTLRMDLPADWPLYLQAGAERWRKALEQAIEDKLIAAMDGKATDELIEALTKLAVAQSFIPPASGPAPIGVLLAGSGVSSDHKNTIAAIVLNQKQDEGTTTLWDNLSRAGVPPKDIKDTRFAMEAYQAVNEHLPTLNALQSLPDKDFGSAADLAQLSRAEWRNVVDGVADLPPGFEGKQEEYAASLAGAVELNFPTGVIAHELSRSGDADRKGVGDWLLMHPEFDALRSPAPLDASPEFLREIAVARLAPSTNRPAAMTAMLEKGLDSTMAVLLRGEVEVTRLLIDLGPGEAGQIYVNARMRASEQTMLVTQILERMSSSVPMFPQVVAPSGSQLANWAEMFGAGNACVCPPCHSVHGPAAYLVDLLHFLSDRVANRPADSSIHPSIHPLSLLDILDERRPDIRHLKLNCDNTDTPLPYIDLVCELLEREVNGVLRNNDDPRTVNSVLWPQTDSATSATSAARLRALPDETNSVGAVYAANGPLQDTNAVYPWNLPFDRSHEIAKLYFGLTGAAAAEVLALSANPGEALHRARLGMSEAVWRSLHGPGTLLSVARAWGFKDDGENPQPDAFLADLEHLAKPGDGSGRLKLGLLARSKLEVNELFELVKSPICKLEAGPLLIDCMPTPDPCDVANARLRINRDSGGIGDLASEERIEAFDLINRVLRLRQALNWPLADLLIVLRALRDRNQPLAINLAHLSRLIDLATRLGLPPARLARHLLAIAANDPQANAVGLSLLRLGAADHAHLLALGMPNSLASQGPAGYLQSLEEALEWAALLRAAGLDPAELRYLLRHEDLTPPVFMPRESELEGQVKSVVDAIDAASPEARLDAAVERLSIITGSTLTGAVVRDEPCPLAVALLNASSPGKSGGVVQDFIVLWAKRKKIDDASKPPKALVDKESRLREVTSRSLLRIRKACRLLDVLKFTPADVKALARLQTGNAGWLNFNLLPTEPVTEPGSELSKAKMLVQTAVAQAAMPAADTRLLELFAGIPNPGDPPKLADIERMTGWGRSIPGASDGAVALGKLGVSLGLGAPESWQNPLRYVRLQAAVSLMQRLRLTAVDLDVLLRPQAAASLEGLEAFGRKRFVSSDDFYAAVAPAMDQLRVKTRDALLGYLLQNNKQGWSRAEDIYDHLLIDVQMGPCQLTSRIVQAHAAIQLFVQRCLLNVEPDVKLGDTSSVTAWRQWQWMKHYRVWEAGRKVFLFPENWIEPELRDLKSPFFEDLETDLLQDEITPGTVERAVRTYLTKLHEVADLDVRALYEEKYHEADGSGGTIERKIMHMAARTYSDPHIYFYRQRSPDLTWTPWEKIEFTIDSDHLVLAVHNRRPTLFWPTWRDVQKPDTNPIVMQWEMQLNVSSREFGRWSAPIRAKPSLMIDQFDAKSSVMLRPKVEESIDLFVHRFVGKGTVSLVSRFSVSSCNGDISLDERSFDEDLNIPLYVWPYEQSLAREGWLTSTYLLSSNGTTNLSLFMRPTTSKIRLMPCHQYSKFEVKNPYAFNHSGRSFYSFRMKPLWVLSELVNGVSNEFVHEAYILESGNHPFVCDMLEAVRSEGLTGLYRPARGPRRHPRQETRTEWVRHLLNPNPFFVTEPYPVDEFDFSTPGAYSLYNWEIFFHVPLLLADRLGEAQRFEDAQKWFHTIFDPTDISTEPEPQKFWQVKPLFQEAGRWSGPAATLQEMMTRLSQGAADVEQQVEAWRNDPFNPHLIARLRLVAYMKVVVQKYVENLIAWADSLFRRDTMESINEATQLYVLASRILGEAPIILPPVEREYLSFHQLVTESRLDSSSNAVLREMDAGLPVRSNPGQVAGRHAPGFLNLYFCIPGNPRLPELRATIADRLLKVRNCMDIEGNTRQLALFAPPIDPALLVRARAAGLDIGAALQMALTPPTPHYRFHALLQKALEFCGEVRSFGGALLAALEKRDGEQLAQMRSRHEVGMLKRVSLIKTEQVREAEANLRGLRSSRRLVESRFAHYESREVVNAREKSQIDNLDIAHNLEITAQSFSAAASIAHLLPEVTIGFPPAAKWGGSNLGNSFQAAGSVIGIFASQHSFIASMSGIMAGNQRRKEDWDFQAELARAELTQVDQQIAAAEIRLEIANKEQENHEQQIAQAEEAETMLREKFTNAQLYGWMSAQLSALHYQAYRMAFDLANQAEAAANYELDGIDKFIRLDNWDSGRKGLLAGDRLAQDLRRLELAYMQRNTRKLEITSNISLRRLAPLALLNLRQSGNCAFSLPPWLFEMDFPGQTNRRIKSVSISVPGVVGPYGGVNGILKLTSPTPTQSIATSSGQNDSGVFQLDFRDERYLPFEGVSLDGNTSWSFTLPAAIHAFDYDTISDLIVHLSYTAMNGAEAPRPPAPVQIASGEYWQLISLRHDFPDSWRQLHEGNVEFVDVVLEDHHFPYMARGPNRSNMQVYRPILSGAIPPLWERREPPLSIDGSGTLRILRADASHYLLVKYDLAPSP
jgi:hypothetical protein